MRPSSHILTVTFAAAAILAAGCAASNPEFVVAPDDRPQADAADGDRAPGPAADARGSDGPTGNCATPVVGTGTGLLAEYFDNPDLTGTRVSRVDATIDFNFFDAPVPGIGADTFSVRWSGALQPAHTGLYTFQVQFNDGVRLFIDGRVVLYRWGDHATSTETATMWLASDRAHDLRMELYDQSGSASAHLLWQHDCHGRQVVPRAQLSPDRPPAPSCPAAANIGPGTGTGLLGEYFGDVALQTALVRRTDVRLDFDWGSAAPAPGIGDSFSARWTGRLESPVTGPLTIYLLADDGGRVWLDGNPAMDSWSETTARQETAVTIDTVAGQQHDLRVELRDRAGPSAARLSWSWPCHDREVVPTSRLYPSTGQ